MAVPHITTAEDTTLEVADRSFSAALVHLRKLLRVKNLGCSSFLQLPTEIIILALSFVRNGCHPDDWRSIFGTCHLIFNIILESTELWREVIFDHTPSSLRAANIAFLRSDWNPRKLIAGFDYNIPSTCPDEDALTFLYDWGNNQAFQFTDLHTLEFSGNPTLFSYFAWVLPEPLPPRLENLKIQITPTSYYCSHEPLLLRLPTNITLRTLDLHNFSLSWSPRDFTGLRELHLHFEFLFFQ